MPLYIGKRLSSFPISNLGSILQCYILSIPKCGSLLAEPVGSVSPKINTGDDYNHIKGKSAQDLSLLCPAQAYPQPFYR